MSEIVRHVKTPAYVYDLDILKQTYTKLRHSLNSDIRIFYSLKANPLVCICNSFHKMNAGAEVASLGELETAICAGFPPEKIIFAGPGKQRHELEAAVGYGILSINAESRDEVKAIGTIAGSMRKRARVSLRINPKKNLSGSQLQMGGYPSPFGIDEEKIPGVLSMMNSCRELEFAGIHVFVGNQIMDPGLAIENVQNTLDIARGIVAARSGSSLKLVNFGGGIGIPYYSRQEEFDIVRFNRELNRLTQLSGKENAFEKTLFLMEPGRYLVAGCGVFLTKVVYIKESRGKKFAVVDGGMNANSMATGNLGQKIPRNFPICCANRMNETDTEKFDIVGPLCTPMDIYGRDYDSPRMSRGDILCAPLSGAYGFTASPGRFLSRDSCAEVAASGGKFRVVRQKERTEHILAKQNF